VCGRERQHETVLGRRRLQLEVELPAEALAQCEPPRAIHAAAEGGVHDELHPARLVEEALEDDQVLRGHAAERRLRRVQIVDQLLRGRLDDAADGEPCERARRPLSETFTELAPQA